MIVKTGKRWMKSARLAAAVCDARFPWERGAPRKAMIARRATAVTTEAVSRPVLAAR